MHEHDRTTPAAVTVSSDVSLGDIETFLAGTSSEYSVSTKPAPGGRGTELHATSHTLSKADLKQALAKARATLEAGEIPTGARR
jgi:hypothetical protein